MRVNERLARQVADVMRLLYQRGLVQVKGGNVSVFDRSEGIIYISPTGVPRHTVGVDDVAVMTLDGRTLLGTPSSEFRLHLAIYREIEGSAAVVHAHPPNLIALYEAGLSLEVGVLTEALIRVGCVTDVPPITPGTQELADEVARALKASGCRAAVLRRHGVAVYSTTDVYEALDAVEALEDAAKVILTSRLRG